MKSITLGGRKFRPIRNSTVEHDFWLLDHVTEAGLDTLTMKGAETADQFAARLLREIIQSGKAFLLMGGLLIPDGIKAEDWTPEIALETAAFIEKLTDPADKALIQQSVVTMLIGFFTTGLALLRISPAFSTAAAVQDGPENVADTAIPAAVITVTGH